MKEDMAPIGLAGWSLVGVLEAGVNPYNGMFFNGPRSLADANTTNNSGLVTINGKNYYFQNQKTNLDSSRAGQWDNSQGYLGVSSPTWGTLTFGRTNSLTFNSLAAYDPMAGSPAFSLIGFSNSFPGYGDTEIVRINTALTYKVAIPNVAGVFNSVRLAGQAQIGGYGVGNGAMAHYEAQFGFDYGNFSFDGILGWAKDAVSLSTFNGGNLGQCGLKGAVRALVHQGQQRLLRQQRCPEGDAGQRIRRRADGELQVGPFQVLRRLHLREDVKPVGFLRGRLHDDVPRRFRSADLGHVDGLSSPQRHIQQPGLRFQQGPADVWTGAKWSVPDEWMHGWGALDLAAAFYYQTQNDYNFTWTTGKTHGVPFGYATAAACTGTGAFISSNKCSGSQDGIGFLADWRPVKRVDIYAGVMITNVYGGLANGYFQVIPVVNGKKIINIQEAHTQSYDPTIGIRIRF